MHETFHTPESVRLRVEVWVGRVDLHAVDTDQTTVDLEPMHGDETAQDLIANARVEQHGDQIDVLLPRVKSGFFGRKGHVQATITVPTDSAITVKTGSADLYATGTFGDAEVETGSGDVQLETIAYGKFHTGSGDVDIRTTNGSLQGKTGSGDLTLGAVEVDADLVTGSGDLLIDAVAGDLKAKVGSGDVVVKSTGNGIDAMAGSGDILVRRIERGQLKAKTGSGDVQVGVAEGTAAYLDVTTVSGDVTSELDGTESPTDDAPTASITVQSGSGDVVLQRA